MPAKRRAAASEAAAAPANKRTRRTADEDATRARRSPRKSRDAPAKAPAAETRQTEGRRPRQRACTGRKVELKSWLSNGTEEDEKAIDRATAAAADAAGDETPEGSEDKDEEEDRLEEEEPKQDIGELEKDVVEPRPVSPPPTKRGKSKKDTPKKAAAKENGSPTKKKKDAKVEPKEETPPPPSKSKSIAADKGTKPNGKMSKKAAEKTAILAARTAGLQHFIGAHVSMAGGVYTSLGNAERIGANAFAIFLKSQRKWDNPPLKDEAVEIWQRDCAHKKYAADKHVLPHGSYLVNLASQTPEQHNKSVDSFLDDLQRCERLGIKLYNFHPGNSNGASKEAACRKIAEAINLAHQKTDTVIPVLETMASNKSTSNTIGGRFEELAMIIKDVKDKERVGVCIDTCHIFAAGYDIVTKDGFKKTMDDFDKIIGRKYLRAWHLNDSKAVKGSGRDLHANIGTGFIGLSGFWNVMNMDIWGKGVGVHNLPMVLETPTDEQGGEAVPKKGEKKEEDKNIWANEIKLLESLIGMDPEGEEFKRLSKELQNRGAGQREKMAESVDKAAAKGKGKGKKGSKKKDSDDESD